MCQVITRTGRPWAGRVDSPDNDHRRGLCCAAMMQGQGFPSALGTNTRRAGLAHPLTLPRRAILGKVAMRISSRSASERDKFWSGCAMGRSRGVLFDRTVFGPARTVSRLGMTGLSEIPTATHRHGPSLLPGPPLAHRLDPPATFWFWSWAGRARRLVLAEPSRFRGRTGRAEQAGGLGSLPTVCHGTHG